MVQVLNGFREDVIATEPRRVVMHVPVSVLNQTTKLWFSMGRSHSPQEITVVFQRQHAWSL